LPHDAAIAVTKKWLQPSATLNGPLREFQGYGSECVEYVDQSGFPQAGYGINRVLGLLPTFFVIAFPIHQNPQGFAPLGGNVQKKTNFDD
jgi:hypothetical protein